MEKQLEKLNELIKIQNLTLISLLGIISLSLPNQNKREAEIMIVELTKHIKNI